MALESFGRFKVEREAGHGSMGRVFLAHDPEIDRRVAVKTLSVLASLPEAEKAEARARFLREARAAGRLDHPGIVTVYDVGEQAGLPYIAMEYLEGVGLDRFGKEPDLLPPRQVAHLIAQAAEALDYAHRAGLVHRDIKPANLMLVQGQKIKITDFGLAKSQEQHLTSDGSLVGTPYYMSPEQFSGEELDGRSDLFSLGVVLYEMLAGKRPFQGDSVSSVMYRILNEDPPPVSSARTGVPRSFDLVVAKALAKDPARRFQSGQELAGALRAAAEGRATAGLGSSRPAPAPGISPTVSRVDEIALESSGSRSGLDTGRTLPPPAPRRKVTRWVLPLVVVGLLGALAAVALFVVGPDQLRAWWGRVAEGGEAAGEGPASPGAPAEGAIPVLVTPAEAELSVEGAELAEAGLLVGPTAGRIVLTARSGCRTETWVREEGEPLPETIEITVPTGPLLVPVASEPEGASILLEGGDTGKVTPAEIELDPCGGQSVTLRRDAHEDWSYTVPAGTAGAEIAEALGAVSLVPLPPGTLVLRRPPYPVSIYEGGRRIARFGAQGGRVDLPPGDHRLTVGNNQRFVRIPASLTIESGAEAELRPRWPELAGVRVIAVPGNCTVSLSGPHRLKRDLGETPVETEVAPGRYTVSVRFVPTGEVQEKSVELAAGQTPRLTFTFKR